MKNNYKDFLWFQKLSNIGQFSYVDLLVIDPKVKAKEKELFLQHEIENPHFSYHLLQEFYFEKKRHELQSLSNTIAQEETNVYVKEAYVRLLEEKLNHLRLLEASRDESDEVFDHVNMLEFGETRESVVATLTPHVRRLIERAEQSGREDIMQSAAYIKNIVHALPYNEEASLIPDDISSGVKDVDAKEIEARFYQSFEEYGIEGWKIHMDTENLNAFVHINQETKTLTVPASRTLSRAHLEALVRHEVGVHIRRRENAEKTSFRLLTLGFDHYIKGDEGLGKYEEYQVFPSAFLPTVEIYLGIALIRGIDGKKRSFRDMFEFFKHYYTVSEWNTHDVSPLDASEYGWKRAEKFFRGTTGQAKGICFTKDVLYLEGYLGIVDTLNTLPQEKERLLVGKYDPGNAFHREVLDGLGIYE